MDRKTKDLITAGVDVAARVGFIYFFALGLVAMLKVLVGCERCLSF